MRASSVTVLSEVFIATLSASGVDGDTHDCLMDRKRNGNLVLGPPKNRVDPVVDLGVSTQPPKSASRWTINDRSSICITGPYYRAISARRFHVAHDTVYVNAIALPKLVRKRPRNQCVCVDLRGTYEPHASPS